MKKAYHVTYFYLATGMEGVPDQRDYGVFYAETASEAEEEAAKLYGGRDWQWMLSCLTAKRV